MQRDWSLILGHEPSALITVLLVVCVGLALAEAVTLVHRRRALVGSAWQAWLVLGLRIVALSCLVAVVLEIGVRIETHVGSSRRVVVLVDTSASMSLADGPSDARSGRDTQVRFDRARTLWRESDAARESWREAGVEIELRTFDSQTSPLTRANADVLDLVPDGGASDLSGALLELADAETGEGAPLAAVVVVSDGLVAEDSAAATHLETIVDSLEVPLTAVTAGGPTLRDIAISELHVGEFAFVENITEFSLDLIAHGLIGERATVSLLRDGEVLESQRLRITHDGEQRTLSFEVAPDRTGAFVYEFRVDPLGNEASEANNHRAFVVKVLRDKVRVLHVAGRPDWDVRALRTLLKRDPNVELLSYYILRDWEDTARDDGTAPLSLIAFPTDELFHEELGSFDLIVMHNFDALRHGDYLGNIADYVEEGGSLVVIGGDLGIATGDYAMASFAKLMPIELRAPAGLEHDAFQPKSTEDGRRHPITAWLYESGHADWHALPALDSFNPADYAPGSAAIDTAALLVHPTRKTRDGRPTPLLTVAEPGRGRVVTLSTGASWRLGFAPDLPLIEGARPYDLLWLGIVRWLLRDASAERLVLELTKTEHQIGEPVELSVRTLSAGYAAEPDVEIEFDVRPLATGETQAPPASGAEPVASGRLKTDGLGRARTRVEGLPAGAYVAEAWRADDPRPDRGASDAEDDPEDDPPELGQAARRVFLIGGGGQELARVDADPGTALLRDLAERSQGDVVEAIEGDELPERLPMAELDELDRAPAGRRDLPLWDSWVALLIALAAFGSEWIVRRRLGSR